MHKQTLVSDVISTAFLFGVALIGLMTIIKAWAGVTLPTTTFQDVVLCMICAGVWWLGGEIRYVADTVAAGQPKTAVSAEALVELARARGKADVDVDELMREMAERLRAVSF